MFVKRAAIKRAVDKTLTANLQRKKGLPINIIDRL
jgi:hypothetical protein